MLCVNVVLSFMDTALRDHRIELVRASSQELTIRIKDVSLSDEGQYTCSLFTMPVKTTKAFLTVLGEILVGVSACVFVMSNFQPTVALWENVCGWTSSENTGVPARPEITGITKPATEGDVITLTCMTTGSKPAARIQWLRNDKEVQGKRAVRYGWSVVSSAARMSSHSAAAFFFLHCSSSLGFTGATIWLTFSLYCTAAVTRTCPNIARLYRNIDTADLFSLRSLQGIMILLHGFVFSQRNQSCLIKSQNIS